MKLTQPPTQKELEDLRSAFRANIPEAEYARSQDWFINWGMYLIGLRRGFQQRFLTEAYNEHSTRT